MSMDSVMDSSSTNSDHSSNASSSASPPVAIKPPVTPPSSNNNNPPGPQQPPHSPPSMVRQPGSPNAVPSVTQQAPPTPQHPHTLSPVPVSTPNSITAVPPRISQSVMPPLPPPGLGLLNSLGGGMIHHSPLDLMAAAHHGGPPRSYNSPPPISSSDPTANECKLVDYRGQKVAAFIIAGDTMLCLPQAFELFLKHLVGGLHTVYTKLKRLDIVPLVCNVEQVRILRGLGAIQPGVNRCKLLSCKDFDILYRDCTTASSRPGRPPKRATVGLSIAASHLAQHHQQLKKHRLDNGEYPGYENGHLGDPPRLEKSPLLANGYNHPPTHLNHMQFMQLNHHPAAAHTAILSPAGIPHHGLARADGSIIKNQGIPGMDAIARSGIWENCRAAYEDIVKHLERLREERGEAERALALDHKVRDLSSHNGSTLYPFAGTIGHWRPSHQCSSNGHSPVLNLSKSGGGSGGEHSGSEAGHTGPEDDEDDDNVSDADEEDEKDQADLSDTPEIGGLNSAPGSDSQHAINYSTLASAAAAAGAVASGVGVGVGVDPSISSTETLLRNIQGLLKVAADNARQQERQINYEKTELKMDVLREREVKENLERQLMEEQKIRVIYQKRLKKERKARRRLQDQLELEMKRRSQLEDALKASGASADALRMLNAESGSEHRVSSGGDQSESSYPRQQPTHVPEPPSEKQWNYSGLDLMGSGAAFWQNYSESLAQELELERKSRQQQQQQQQQQQAERDVKSPLQESRAGYYKNSVLFTSAT
ncbi:dachshund homolog 2 isoform X2 [Cryptotermes secundus]|uniref:dachshund homolog 2 isoform X2 n=1 Tax=Cryptotermes secundus TaxID=105785 RepID=UPI000CD7AC78|nr:dachshund homolog 2 isoform X2 [Cryptotermes secundus]